MFVNKSVCLVFVAVIGVASRALRQRGATHGADDPDPELQLTPAQKTAFYKVNTNRQTEEHSQAPIHLWPDGVIKYKIKYQDFSEDNIRVLRRAMEEISKFTCLTFRPKTSEESNYVTFQTGNGCSSYLGMIDGGQAVTLGQGCKSLGIMEHEILHAAGMIHEHSLSNRDAYIHINTENIFPELTYAFDKYQPFTYRRQGVPYSYDSVMHYGQMAFSTNGKATINTVQRDKQDRIGQRSGIGYSDVHVLNKIYHCADHCMRHNVEVTKCHARGISGHLDKDCRCLCEDGSQDCDATTAGNGNASCINAYFNSWECYRRADDNECDSNQTWMRTNCAKACGMCTRDDGTV